MTETQPEPYYHYPGNPSEQSTQHSSGCGCWIAGITTLVVVSILIVGGLLLPPISLAERLMKQPYTILDAVNNGIQTRDQSFALIVDPADPGTGFGASLNSISMDKFLTNTSEDWIQSARAAVPPLLTLESAVYSIDTTGTPPEELTLTLTRPTEVNADLLDVYAWSSDTNNWYFVPVQPTIDGQLNMQVDHIPDRVAIFQAMPPSPTILTSVEIGQVLRTDTQDVVSIAAPVGMQPALPSNQTRTLVGNPTLGANQGGTYKVMPAIRNFTDPRATDPDTVMAIISNSELRDEHIQELTAFATAGNYDGLFIDYRDLDPAQRTVYSSFIRELANALDRARLSLGVIIPAAENVEARWETGAYDWRELGEYADFIQINFGLDPTIFIPGEDHLVEAMLRWGVGEINRYKLLASVSALSVQEIAGGFSTISYDEALSGLGNVQLDTDSTPGGTIPPGSEIHISLDGYDALPGVDATIWSPFVDYYADDESLTLRMWLTTGEALRFRLDRLLPFAVAGVAFPDLLSDGIAPDVLEAIVNYKIQLPAEIQPKPLVLKWRIENADGEVTTFVSELREEIVVTLDAPDGNYAVNVEVASGDLSSAREGAAVALFAATATPTPRPTATSTMIPSLTPTLVPIVATAIPENVNPAVGVAPAGQPPPPAVSGPAIRPGAGSISLASGFAYGGHVTGPGNERAVDAMRSAGMTWMKVQLPWGTGDGTETAATYIRDAHANGFKILIGLVGDPSQLAAGGGEYIQQFGGFAGGVAALGADAIEIWNEPNLAREWPEGQISGANYTALLRESYNAIKASNPSVTVISAAPAPTGAELAYPGKVVNDDNFLRQMVEAGALNFTDCVGMHYNEGLVGPRQTSGDPRGDNYYTRYLPTLLDVYWGIVGGQRPICITELGYLTPEGYGALDSFFAWAQNVTVAQQAAWLADAAAYTSNSGRVRLMIIWNVDFEFYGADPMAGYAIIRPDGSCPACSALAGAR